MKQDPVLLGRFHVVLSLPGGPPSEGWWGSEAVARRRFAAWVGMYGRPGVRVTLRDEETGETLTEWPTVE